jgi:hypothetical protein
VYHIELRQSFHNLCHFNLDAGALGAIVKAWTTDPWVEIEGRKWNPQQARLRIIEGPELPLAQLTMGRGWRAAERQGTDVSERILAAATEAARAAAQGGPQQAAGQQGVSEQGAPRQGAAQQAVPDAALEADSLGLELLSLLADGPAPLYYAWRLAAKRLPERTPGEALMLAERSVKSLLNTGLIVLVTPAGGSDGGRGEPGSDGVTVGEQELQQVLNAHDSWARPEHSTAVRMRRT